jgi:putative flippase GtrA
MKQQIIRFGCIGSAAAAVHIGVVALLVPFGLHPLLANIVGFVTAFNVSYFGHRFWTFGNRTTLSHKNSATRFWAIAVTSFAINETLFFLFLRYTALPYLVALFLVLIMVTPITFILSRSWAFAK